MIQHGLAITTRNTLPLSREATQAIPAATHVPPDDAVPRTAVAAIEFLLQQRRDGFFVELPLVDGLGVFMEANEQKEGVAVEKRIKKQHTP